MLDLRSAEKPGRVGGDDETADAVVGLGPDDGDVGDGAVGDPHLAAVEDPVAAVAAGAGAHAAGVGAGVGLGETEAADRLPRRHAAAATRFFCSSRAPAPDGEHGQRSLDRDQRPDAGVGGLELEARQAVLGGRHARAAVALQVHAEHAERAELLGQAADVVDLRRARTSPRRRGRSARRTAGGPSRGRPSRRR